MNIFKKIITCGVLLAALLITSCDWSVSASEYMYFDYNLRGTWVSVSSGPNDYSGALLIGPDQITITGYDQNPANRNENQRPFKSLPRGVAIYGFSAESKLFIGDTRSSQQQIPYYYSSEGNNPQVKFLTFIFGNRKEILKQQ